MTCRHYDKFTYAILFAFAGAFIFLFSIMMPSKETFSVTTNLVSLQVDNTIDAIYYPDETAQRILEQYVINELVYNVADEIPYVYGIMTSPPKRDAVVIVEAAMRYDNLLFQREELVCLATNMYHEARSEGRQGLVAVGWVTLNRRNSEQFPDTICDVVYQRNQFAWVFELGASRWDTKIKERGAYEDALTAAQFLYHRQDTVYDYTAGAQYFLSPMPDGLPKPSWSRKFEQTFVYKRHTFYRDNRKS